VVPPEYPPVRGHKVYTILLDVCGRAEFRIQLEDPLRDEA